MLFVPSLVEPCFIPDTFVGQIARIDAYGSAVRVVFSSYQPIAGARAINGAEPCEYVAVAKIVFPRGNAMWEMARVICSQQVRELMPPRHIWVGGRTMRRPQ